jgi:sugar phosphate isomerase/epimerase
MRAAHALNQIGGACRERGFEFFYHHHSFEFQRFGGRTGMDILLENAEPSLVKIELDTYWLKHGGEDPAAFVAHLGKRAPLVHLKDMGPDPEQKFVPVGSGTLDFPAILDAMSQAHVRWGIVEQDQCYGQPPLDQIRMSLQYLHKLTV